MSDIRRLLIANAQQEEITFTEVEYAGFDGSAFVDLGVGATQNTKTYIRFYNTQASGSNIYGNAENPYYYTAIANSNKLIFGYSSTDYSTNSTTCTLNTWHTVEFAKSGITLDNTSIQSFSSALDFSINDLYLGAVKGLSTKFYGRVSIARIYESSILVHEYIPVKLSNGIVAFYDNVTQTIKYPTGTLTAGREIHRVTSLTSSNKAYIDTKIASWNNTIEEEIKCTIETQSSGYRNWWGAYDKWTSDGRQVPNIGTYHALKTPASFKAGTTSTSGVVDIGIQYGETGIYELKGNTVSWSEGTSATFDRLTSQPFTMNQSIGLFCTHKGSSFDQFGNVTIFYAKFWLNSILVGHFQPARDENNTGFMFDEVTHAIFDNAGSGSFACGADL